MGNFFVHFLKLQKDFAKILQVLQFSKLFIPITRPNFDPEKNFSFIKYSFDMLEPLQVHSITKSKNHRSSRIQIQV